MASNSFDSYHIPSLDEVRAYATEKGYKSDPAAFYAKYTKAHWKQGGSRIKSWTMLFDSWERIEAKRQKTGPQETIETVRPEYLSRLDEKTEELSEEEREKILDDINAKIAIIEEQIRQYERQKHQYQTDDNVGV